MVSPHDKLVRSREGLWVHDHVAVKVRSSFVVGLDSGEVHADKLARRKEMGAKAS